MNLRLALVTCVTILAVPGASRVAAECGFEPLWRSIQQANVAVVFSGTVVGIQSAAAGHILTFKVDTVWKGNVSRMMLIHHPNGLSGAPNPSRADVPPPKAGVVVGLGGGRGVGPAIASGFRPFELTRRYVVTAHPLTDEERAWFKVNLKGEYLAVTPCGGILFDDAQTRGDLDRMGPGRIPQ